MDDKMEFEFIDWQLYFGVFQDRLTRQPQPKYLQRCPFALFMTAYELEFRDKAPRQALPLYREASELLEPFSCYRLAEIYLKPNKFNEAVDFELSWFYLVKSTVLGCIFYSKDVFKGKQKLGRYIERLDNNHVNCLNLIDKFENKSYALLLKYCFKLVITGAGINQNLQYSYSLLKELEALLRRQPKPHLIGLAVSLITARLELRHKPIDRLLETLLMNGPALSEFTQELFALLGGLVTCQKDNILMSKVRDTALELYYLSQIFKFTVTDLDLHFNRMSETLFNIFCRLYDNIDKVTVLQDRIFITFYLTTLLHRQGKKQHCREVFKALEELMTIKPQPSTQGFFLHLKAKIEGSKDSLQKAASAFQREEQSQENLRMTVQFYLSRIDKKLGNAKASEEHLLNAYKLYRENHERWNELTLQTTYYYRKICRMLKRVGKYPQFQLPKRLVIMPFAGSVTRVGEEQAIRKESKLKLFNREAVRYLRVLAKMAENTFSEAIVHNTHALAQQFPVMDEPNRNKFVAELEQKHAIDVPHLHPIVGYSQEQYYNDGLSYYALQVFYPPCFLYQPATFEHHIGELLQSMPCINQVLTITNLNYLIKAYNLAGDVVVAGWAATSLPRSADLPISVLQLPFLSEFMNRYNLEFLYRRMIELNAEPLRDYLQKLFARI